MPSKLIVSLAVAVALTGCTRSTTNGLGDTSVSASSGSSTTQSHPAPSHAPTTQPHPASSSAPPVQVDAARVLASMTEAQRVGQLIMMDNPSTSISGTTISDIKTHYIGGVILDGNSDLSISATKSLTNQLQAATGSVGLLISTDQEGGLVRRLRGPGFTNMPSAVVQGTVATSSLRSQAKTWGLQLKAAGVNMDLAPVMDTVPANSPGNPPIGDLDREYGHDPVTVASHGTAVAQGFADAGVAATIKHFPGLGRVSGNTDTASHVTDTVTTASDAYLQPFATAISDGVPLVMMSTAIYSQIDPGVPAAFSSKIIGGVLRQQLGFGGIVISDDLGAARQVASYSVGDRATDFVAAGGDIVLTVDRSAAVTMADALLSRAQSDPGFKAKVDAAALLVLQEKQRLGLLH